MPALVVPALQYSRYQKKLRQDVTQTCREHFLALQAAAQHQQSSFGNQGKCRRVARQAAIRSEEHTSELQSLMRISYAVFCLKKKIYTTVHYFHTYLQHINCYNITYKS